MKRRKVPTPRVYVALHHPDIETTDLVGVFRALGEAKAQVHGAGLSRRATWKRAGARWEASWGGAWGEVRREALR